LSPYVYNSGEEQVPGRIPKSLVAPAAIDCARDRKRARARRGATAAVRAAARLVGDQGLAPACNSAKAQGGIHPRRRDDSSRRRTRGRFLGASSTRDRPPLASSIVLTPPRRRPRPLGAAVVRRVSRGKWRLPARDASAAHAKRLAAGRRRTASDHHRFARRGRRGRARFSRSPRCKSLDRPPRTGARSAGSTDLEPAPVVLAEPAVAATANR